jgi:hypothetical protein
MINECVSPWPPPRIGTMSPDINTKPWSPGSPVVATWPVPQLISKVAPRIIVWAPVIVMVDITMARPSIPVIIAKMMDYRNSGWFLLEILNSNVFQIKAVFTLSHDMHLQAAVFHVPARGNTNGLRGPIGTQDKRVAIKGNPLSWIYLLLCLVIKGLDPKSSSHLIVL